MESTDFWGRLEDPAGWIVLLDSGVGRGTRKQEDIILEFESGCIGCILVFSYIFMFFLNIWPTNEFIVLSLTIWPTIMAVFIGGGWCDLDMMPVFYIPCDDQETIFASFAKMNHERYHSAPMSGCLYRSQAYWGDNWYWQPVIPLSNGSCWRGWPRCLGIWVERPVVLKRSTFKLDLDLIHNMFFENFENRIETQEL